MPTLKLPDLPFLASTIGAAGDFPQALEDALFYFDGDDPGSSLSDGDFMDTWQDLSVFGRTVTTPAAGAQRPIYRVNTDGLGHNAVEFGSTVARRFEFTNISTPVTTTELIMVIEAFNDPNIASSDGPIRINNIAAGGGGWPFLDGKLNSRYGASTLGSGGGSIIKPNLFTSPRLCNVISRPNVYEVYVDGELLFYGDINTVGFGASIHIIGAANPGFTSWPGYAYKLIGWDHALTPTQRTANKNALLSDFSIADQSDPDPWDPDTELSTDLFGHWDVSQLVGLSDTDTIETLPDLVNSNDWTQATAGSRPIYRTGIQNGLPIARFDGSKFWQSVTAAFGSNAPFTVVMVSSFNADGAILSNSATNVQIRGRRANINTQSFFAGAAPEITGNFTGRTLGAKQMAVWKRSNTGVISFMQGGSRITSSAASGSFTINRFGSQPFGIPFNGDFCEGWIWTRLLSETELFKLYGYYLHEKWGLTA